MPTHSQNMVEITPTEYAKGRSSTTRLQGIYAGSPIYDGSVSDSGLQEEFQKDVLDAVINDGGHTFGTFDTAFVDAPNLEDVATGGGGLPATPYVPNPTSPGEGSMLASDQAAAPTTFGTNPSDQWGSGVGHALQPKESSERISSQTLGDYIMGKSSQE